MSKRVLFWKDYGLQNFGLAGDDGMEPEPYEQYAPGFGAFAGEMGIISGGLGILAEVEPDPKTGLARTPMLEVHPLDFEFIKNQGRPYHGMLALGDDGGLYMYDGLNGFFSSLFSGAKKLFHKVVGIAKKVVKALPGGKYLVKIADKIHNTAMKLVKPLMKYVGPLATKLAPIAAIIPGYGPAIAAGLRAGGEIAAIMNHHDVKQSDDGRLKFPSAKAATEFQKDIKQAAAKKRAELKAAHSVQSKHRASKAAKKSGASATLTAAQILAQMGFMPAHKRG